MMCTGSGPRQSGSSSKKLLLLWLLVLVELLLDELLDELLGIAHALCICRARGSADQELTRLSAQLELKC